MIESVAYFLVLLQPGAKYESEPDHRDAHVAFIETMERENVVLLGGWFDEAIESASAAYLLHVASAADAAGWAAKDPYVAHEIFRPRVVAWNLVGIARSAIDPAFGAAQATTSSE